MYFDIKTVIVNEFLDFILKVISGSANATAVCVASGRGAQCVFLSITSWKSRSVRLQLEIYHVPQLSSFDFNQEKKNYVFSSGGKLVRNEHRGVFTVTFFRGGESLCPGASRAERLPLSA